MYSEEGNNEGAGCFELKKSKSGLTSGYGYAYLVSGTRIVSQE
jgi:hypothetical protein